jgi:hypothetical protein
MPTFDDFRKAPVEGGTEVAAESLSSRAPFDIAMPSHPLAAFETVDAAWVSDVRVGISFTSGVLVIEEPPQIPNAETEFAGLVADSLIRADARVGSVKSLPALVIEPATDATGDYPGSVQFVLGDVSKTDNDGLSITIYGLHLSAEALIEVAETVAYA